MVNTQKLYFFSLVGVVLFLNWQCGSVSQSNNEQKSSNTNISYALERMYTNSSQINLIIHANKSAGYKYKLSGTGFSADVALDAIHTVKETTVLTYTEQTTYKVFITIYQKDGAFLLKDSLQWQYSLEKPPNPVIAFQVQATSKDTAILLVSSNRGPHVKEISLVGDLLPSTASSDGWYPIPDSGELVVSLSKKDGVKKFTTKLRNIFFTETKSINLQIIKKTTKPVNCKAVPIASTTASDSLLFYIDATDPYPMYYQVSGSGAKLVRDTQFNGTAYPTLSLSNSNSGPHEIDISIRDIAGNLCDVIKNTVTIDPNYLSTSLVINEGEVWTNDGNVTLTTHFDHFTHIKTEMLIRGQVATGTNTFAWIPIKDSNDIALQPTEGNRSIEVLFRDELKRSGDIIENIFLNPFLIVKNSAPNYTLLLSPFVPLENITITGCQENYSKIAYSLSVPCTSSGSEVSATYLFTDGTNLQLTSKLL